MKELLSLDADLDAMPVVPHVARCKVMMEYFWGLGSSDGSSMKLWAMEGLQGKLEGPKIGSVK